MEISIAGLKADLPHGARIRLGISGGGGERVFYRLPTKQTYQGCLAALNS